GSAATFVRIRKSTIWRFLCAEPNPGGNSLRYRAPHPGAAGSRCAGALSCSHRGVSRVAVHRKSLPIQERAGSERERALSEPGEDLSSEPDSNSTLYCRPFDLQGDAVVKMRTFRPNGRASRTIVGVDAA